MKKNKRYNFEQLKKVGDTMKIQPDWDIQNVRAAANSYANWNNVVISVSKKTMEIKLLA